MTISTILNNKSVSEINNVISELSNAFEKYTLALNPYDVDIYLQIDIDTNDISIIPFENVGGNSWLTSSVDSVIIRRVHTIRQAYNRKSDVVFEYINSLEEIADTLEVSFEEAVNRIIDEYGDDCDLTEIISDYSNFIDVVEKYYQKEIDDKFEDCINEMYNFYGEAEEIIHNAINGEYDE